MRTASKTRRAKDFGELRKQIDVDPARVARVREHKHAMLAELRRELDLTQAVLADRLEVSQENVSQIERAQTDVRLSTLERYIEALGGRLELRAGFGKRSVTLDLGKTRVGRRKRASRSSARKATGGGVAIKKATARKDPVPARSPKAASARRTSKASTRASAKGRASRTPSDG